MTQDASQNLTERIFAPLAASWVRTRLSAGLLAFGAFLAGIGGAGTVMSHFGIVAIVLFLLSRILFGIVQAAAPDSRMLSAMLGPIALAAMPFGFALGDPSRALAALFLMLGILVSVVSVSAVGENARAQMSVVLFAVISTLGIALACVMPGWFGPIAYGIGVLAFVQCGLLLAAQVVEK